VLVLHFVSSVVVLNIAYNGEAVNYNKTLLARTPLA